jgi:NitT/TauT family transport system substrate-binding protein
MLLLCCSCATETADISNPPLYEINVCTSSSTGTQTAVAYALEKGVFRKHGLEVTVTAVDSGTRAVAAVLSESAQICQISGNSVVNAAAAGADLSIVGVLISRNPYSLFVAPNIHGAADLKGKAVAVSSIGSASEMSMRTALGILGLRPHTDVTILALGGQGERIAALEAGYVAGTLAFAPETSLVRQRGYRTLIDLSALNLPDVHTATVVTSAYLAANRDVVSRFLKATIESVFRLKTNRAEALRILAGHLQLDIEKDAPALNETYDTVILRGFGDLPYPSLSSLQTMIDEIAADNPDVARVKPEQLADLSLVQEIDDSGFLTELARQQQK